MHRLARAVRWGLLAVVVCALVTPRTRAQFTSGEQHVAITNGESAGRYEGLYGTPQWVSLESIARGDAPRHTALRTSGLLQVTPVQGGSASSAVNYVLVSADRMAVDRGSLSICPVPEIAGNFTFGAAALRYHEVEVVGTLEPLPSDTCGAGSGFMFWSYSVVEPKSRGPASARLSIDSVVRDAMTLRGKTVRVIGHFRGRNLFGDATGGEPAGGGWLIADGGSSLWIVGHEPKGKGFALDPDSKGDGKWWVEVTGRPEVRGEVVVLRAQDVILVSSPGAP